jgi:hypothetical protein
MEKVLHEQSQQKPQQQVPPAATQQAAPQTAGQGRSGFQSMNPDISAIIDAAGGYERRQVAYRSGDDPDLRSLPQARAAGFTVQELELAVSAIIDPYFKGEVYLTIPNLQALEIEEAFAVTTSLPWNLQVKAGTFRSSFGRQNGMHLHTQDFTRRPLINDAFLGEDGLRGPGAQVSWLAPLPVFLTLNAEAFSIGAPDVPASNQPIPPVQSFGGGSATDLTYVGTAKLFLPLSDEWSMQAGFSSAFGVSPGFLQPIIPGAFPGADRRSVLLGADLYVKWKPPNVAGGYGSLAWQTEVIFRHLGEGGGLGSEWDGGLYSQVVLQFAQRWFLGVRGDWIGAPTSSVVSPTLRGALSLTFQASEFARLRLYGELEHASPSSAQFIPTVQAVGEPTTFATYLQAEFSLGAHGAHPY